jgi:hypothetical protein
MSLIHTKPSTKPTTCKYSWAAACKHHRNWPGKFCHLLVAWLVAFGSPPMKPFGASPINFQKTAGRPWCRSSYPGYPQHAHIHKYKFYSPCRPTLTRGLFLRADSTKMNNSPASSQLRSEPIPPGASACTPADVTMRSPALTSIICRGLVGKPIDDAVLITPSWFAPEQLDALQEVAVAGAKWPRRVYGSRCFAQRGPSRRPHLGAGAVL